MKEVWQWICGSEGGVAVKEAWQWICGSEGVAVKEVWQWICGSEGGVAVKEVWQCTLCTLLPCYDVHICKLQKFHHCNTCVQRYTPLGVYHLQGGVSLSKGVSPRGCVSVIPR